MPVPLPRRLARLFLLGAIGAGIAGCVSQGPFPSLAPRPGEGEISLAEPVHPTPVVADDDALRRQIAELLAQARAGDRAFAAAYDDAATAVARAGPSGADSWVGAQEALTRLEAARGDTPAALSALDRLGTEHSDQPTSPGDFAAIQAATAEADRIAGAQNARIAALRARLPD